MSKKTRREPLSTTLRDALLRGPIKVEPPTTEAQTLGEHLDSLRAQWESALALAQKTLDENPLTPIIARDLARQKGRRGTPRITLDPNGQAFLEFGYKPRRRKAKIKGQKAWSSKLPSLAELRVEAEDRGIDVSDLGRSKKQILERLNGVRPKPEPVEVEPEPVPVEPDPEPEIDYTGELCSVCGSLQYMSPAGVTCENGHGGAPAANLIEDEDDEDLDSLLDDEDDDSDDEPFLQKDTIESVRRHQQQTIDRAPRLNLDHIKGVAANIDLDKALQDET